MAESLGQKMARWLREGVPIQEILRRREEFRNRSHAEAVKELKEEKERKEAARVARMKPVSKCFRIGRQIFWEAPDSPEPVIWYRIHEQNGDGSWGVHGTTLPPTARESVLYGDALCRIEAKYAQTGFATPGLGPVLQWNPEDGRFLVNGVRYYVAEKMRQGNIVGANRWRRALAGMGVTEAKVGIAGGPLVHPLEPAMTAEEAQSYVDKGWNRWIPVARTMARLQNWTKPLRQVVPDPEPKPEPKPEEVTLILSAVTSNANTGAFGQHRTPPRGGSISPSSFTIGGQVYKIRGWYMHKTYTGYNFQLNLNSAVEETRFKEAGITIDLGQGDVINSSNMAEYGSTINHRISKLYEGGKTYKIKLTK